MIPIDRLTTAKDVRRKIIENMSLSLGDPETEEKVKEYVFWWSIVESGGYSNKGDKPEDKKDGKDKKEKEKGREKAKEERRLDWDERVWGWRIGEARGTLSFKMCFKFEDSNLLL